MPDVFNVEIFFIVFRESLEAIIVVSVLFAFLKQGLGGANEDPVVYKKLVKQVWLGSILGVLVCIIIGCAFIGTFYSLGRDIWASSEEIWEGTFCLIATILISMMGIPMLRINKMKEKWRVKLAKALLKTPEHKKDRLKISYLTKKYAMFILPFVTCLREGLEAVVYVGGVGLSSSAKSFPLAVICGLIAGITCGVIMYYSGATVSLQVLLVISTSILYLLSSGLMSRAVWDFEAQIFNQQTGGDASENGSGPGTYNIHKSVWHVNCCNPELNNRWGIFNSLLGWQNSATYGSVISYNVYWIAVIAVLMLMMYEEKHGHLPFTKNLTLVKLNPMYHIKNKKKDELTEAEKQELFAKVKQQRFGVDDIDELSSSSSKKEAVVVESNEKSE